MNWRKTALWAAGIPIVLAVGCVVALKVIVDPERLKAMARERVRAVTGRELMVERIDLSFFPVPAVHATKVALANPGWAREKNLVQIDEVYAHLALLPLLAGRMQVKTLSLEGVHAALEEADDGAVSWSFERAGAEADKRAPGKDAGMLDIDVLRIRKASILHLAGREKAEPWQVEEAHVTSGAGMRDVVIEATVSRHQQPLTIKAELADLSALGTEGAVSDGKVTLAWAETQVSVAGKFPLEKTLKGHDLKAEAKSKSLRDFFQFMGFDRGATAPFSLKLAARDGDGRMTLSDIALTLGALNVRGEVRITPDAKRPTYAARLEADRIEWLKTLVDAGGKVRPPRRDGQIYHEDPVAWRALGLVGAAHGTAEVKVGLLKLGSGLELEKVRATAALGEGRIDIRSFATEMLGGSASGSLRFDAPKKTIQARIDGEGLLLERWFTQRGSTVPLKGGPMAVKASLTLSGDTFRDLAASVTGPFTLRMGRATWNSKRAGEFEDLMVNALAAKDSDELAIECAAVKLDFGKGRAEGRHLIGARSDVSQLVTGGHVDFRDETLDLRGRVQARKGVSLGLAAIAGGLQVTGRIAKPRLGMDPAEKPAILARAAAAIASSGATLLGEALLDAASRDDACEAVFK
jgi:uncharacterized protein involved in outer membrane biogenesis